MPTFLVVLGAALVMLVANSPQFAGAAQTESNERCLTCHSSDLDTAVFEFSRHGNLDCVGCHSDKSQLPHDELNAAAAAESASLITAACESCHSAAAREYHSNDSVHLATGPGCGDCHGSHDIAGAPETPDQVEAVCTACHGNDAARMASSVHGDAPSGGASCTDCHGSHAVIEATVIEPEMCSSCHADAVNEYGQSVHGTGVSNGDPDVASCGDCHGSLHDMVPIADANSPLYSLNLPQACARCHADAELAARHGIEIEDAYQLYMDSIHGHALWESGLLVAAGCSECHGTHDILPKEDPDSLVNRNAIPQTCGTCHAGILADYEESIHGTMLAAGISSAPTCTDCHSAHEIAEVDEKESQLRIVGECGACHKESHETFSDTFHGQISDLGFTSAAQCSDCHGSHNILPAAHPASRVSDANLIATCRECHESANANFVMYSPHADADDREANPGLYWLKKFMETLIIGVFVVFGIHTLLWTTRSLIVRRRGGPEGPVNTLGGTER